MTAAAAGLSLGLVLHGPWETHRPGGPQIWFSSAAAEELARPALPDEPVKAEAWSEPEPQPDPLQYAGYLPPDPLPVVRLAADRFDPPQDAAAQMVAPAAEGWPERQDVDAVSPGADVPSPPSEAPSPPSSSAPSPSPASPSPPSPTP